MREPGGRRIEQPACWSKLKAARPPGCRIGLGLRSATNGSSPESALNDIAPQPIHVRFSGDQKTSLGWDFEAKIRCYV
jgi:hypothetical protein